MAPHLMGYVKQETGSFNSSLIVIALVAFVCVAIGGSFGSKRPISPGAET
jgi:cyanate permease